ncbi:MAG TPA: aminotransferase class I/II-fold pyridoxal phosphate-dependent enzyme, partial [Candidatus Nanopelagicales bacterium]|nr:aminotransferase class I/II-fold pyridoxal phosphate-dependent enzyme [Candidatus Nanopelagicales bacterium]
SVMPFLARGGVIFTDHIVHAVVWEACRLARDHGARVEKFRHQDPNDLEDRLKKVDRDQRKIIAVDGVYSISSEIAPMKELNELCNRYNAYLYVDDAHGFGVLGRAPDAEVPLGYGGAGVMSYNDVGYENTFYVSSFGKAFGTSTAFITIPERFDENLRANCTQYLFSAPPSAYTAGTVDAALDLNQEVGDARRKVIVGLTRRFCAEVRALGFEVLNVANQPVVYVTIGSFDRFLVAARTLIDAGVLPGLRAYPLVPPDRCGFRFAISALHRPEQLDRVIEIFRKIAR